MKILEDYFSAFVQADDIPPVIRSTVVTLSATLFQGMVYMDRTERVVKISLTVCSASVLSAILPVSRHKIIKSIVLSHLLNFFFNGHPWAAVKGFGFVHTTDDQFEYWRRRLEALGTNSDSIAVVAVYGSHVRGERGPTSDLDVRVVRHPGAWNGVVASLLIATERARASLTRFPLDIYVLDSLESLHRLRADERPDVLVDEENWLEAHA